MEVEGREATSSCDFLIDLNSRRAALPTSSPARLSSKSESSPVKASMVFAVFSACSAFFSTIFSIFSVVLAFTRFGGEVSGDASGGGILTRFGRATP